MDFRHRQVDKHASDLGRITLHEFLDEFENSASNSLLVLGVHFVDCVQNTDSNAVELVGERVS